MCPTRVLDTKMNDCADFPLTFFRLDAQTCRILVWRPEIAGIMLRAYALVFAFASCALDDLNHDPS